MPEEELDYTPRSARGRKGRSEPARRKGPSEGNEDIPDYTPRPARTRRTAKERWRDRPSRPAQRERPAKRGKRQKFFGSKAFWRLAAVAGLIVLVGVPLLAELLQSRQTSPEQQLNALLRRVDENPQDTDAWLELGHLYYAECPSAAPSEQLQDAVQVCAFAAYCYEQVMALAPGNADVQTDLGTMYLYQGMLLQDEALKQKAIDTWNGVLAYAPDKPETLYNLGVGYIELGRKEDAVTAWQRVLEVAPADSEIAAKARARLEEYRGP